MFFNNNSNKTKEFLILSHYLNSKLMYVLVYVKDVIADSNDELDMHLT